MQDLNKNCAPSCIDQPTTITSKNQFSMEKEELQNKAQESKS